VTESILLEAEVMWQENNVSVMYGGLRGFGWLQYWKGEQGTGLC
jgi:hypothetical protein